MDERLRPRRRARWRLRRQPQVCVDALDHRGLFDRSDDFQLAATLAMLSAEPVNVAGRAYLGKPTFLRFAAIRSSVAGENTIAVLNLVMVRSG